MVVEVCRDDELHGVPDEVEELEGALEELVVVHELGQVVCRAAQRGGTRGGEHVVGRARVILRLAFLWVRG